MTLFRGEGRVLGLLLVSLALIEFSLARLRPMLSGDIRHLDATPALVDELWRGEGERILLAGNSLMGEGLDPVALERMVEGELGTELNVGMVRPDGTTPLEWYYLYRKLVFLPGKVPDLLVIGFGPGHLRDRAPSSALLRLAMHHVDRRDMLAFVGEELSNIEDRSTFVLAHLSSTFGLRDRIASRVLAAIVPSYRELSPMLLQPARGTSSEGEQPTFEYLARLLALANEHGIPVWMVPMPAPTGYDVDTGALTVIDGAGAALVQVNPVRSLTPEMFPDGEHLNGEGREIFTATFASAMTRRLGRAPPDAGLDPGR